jgi:lipopolysaccharide/colanic/teichoic acid biosynthesis glycosyltransferase
MLLLNYIWETVMRACPAPLPSSTHATNGSAAATVRVSSYYPVKRLLDRVAAAMLLVPGLPLIAALVVLIRLTSRGPGIYAQCRVGRNGRTFTMYKLRSMRSDAEMKSGPVWSVPGHDPRVTPLGYWLRKLHLDELPQLFNVLRGDMSLIGPRPERPEFVEVLSDKISDYSKRLLVEPGITGLAQINLPPDTDLNSVRRKIVLDLEYIRTAGPLLDFRMLLCTLLRLVGLKGEIAMHVMLLRRHVPEIWPTDEANPFTAVTPDVISSQISGEAAANYPVRNRSHANDRSLVTHSERDDDEPAVALASK